MPNIHTTREGWLDAGARALRDRFFCDGGEDVPALPEQVRCSCSWPLRGAKGTIGQCFSPEVAADGSTHVIVCPSQDEPVRVLDILLHELGHAAVGVVHQHKAPFKRFMRAVGLEGKATATVATPGTPLHDYLTSLAEELGPYPHKAVSKERSGGEKKAKRKGWPRLMSLNDPEYKVVISEKSLEKGYPDDPWGDPMVRCDDETEDE